MLETQRVKELLGHVPLLKGCSDRTLEAISMISTEIDYKKREVLYEIGDDAVNVYILVKGLVSFTTKTGVGLLNVQHVMEHSMIFGWVALVPEHPHRLGSAEFLDDSKVLAINGDALLGILERDPSSGFLVMKRLCSLIASTFIEKR